MSLLSKLKRELAVGERGIGLGGGAKKRRSKPRRRKTEKKRRKKTPRRTAKGRFARR